MSNREDIVQAALKGLSDSLRSRQAPPRLERALLHQFRAQRHRPRGWWRPLLAAAAVASLAAVILNYGSSPKQELAHQAEELATDYMPIGFAPLAPGEFTQVIRISVPGSELHRFGLPTLEAGSVQADVLLGEDGIARAVRFVH